MNDKENSFEPAPLLSQQMFEFLREQIINGQIQEGERLSETSLQKKFRASRSPIREALRRLEVEGLVEILPRRGNFVRRISVEDLREATEVRASLEGLATRLAADRITRGQLETLKKLLNQMDERLRMRDVEQYTLLHHRFHRTLVEVSGNHTLARLHAIVTEPFISHRLTYVYLKRLHGFREIDHRQIYQALRAGEGIRACHLVERHVMTALQTVMPQPYKVESREERSTERND